MSDKSSTSREHESSPKETCCNHLYMFLNIVIWSNLTTEVYGEYMLPYFHGYKFCVQMLYAELNSPALHLFHILVHLQHLCKY